VAVEVAVVVAVVLAAHRTFPKITATRLWIFLRTLVRQRSAIRMWDDP